MKFAIIMPTYNRSKIIKRAIQSVKEQTYSDWEIFIVDDHSTEEHKNKIMDFIKNEDKIHYFYLPENKGHCYARNYALQQIDCENVWVKYLDDDDIILPTCLYDINEFVENSKYTVITSNYLKITETGQREIVADYTHKSVFHSSVDTCAICHSIDLYHKIGGWDERMKRMADDDFFFKYIPNGNYGYLNKATSAFYAFENEKDRVSNQYDKLKYLKLIASKYDYFKDKKCLVIVKNLQESEKLLREEFDVKSFLDFDISINMKQGYNFVVSYNNFGIPLNKIFERYYQTNKTTFNMGGNVFIKKR